MLNRLLFTLVIITSTLNASWSEYKTDFIAKDGRVIDRVNGAVTHSEGIGYAMYFAIRSNDLETFKRINNWYKNNLKKNEYGLVSWKWGKDKDGSWHVLDTNNASDGDLWIAYDNLLMYEITKELSYKNDALLIMKSIKKQLIVKYDESLYLLPGKLGFNTKDSLEINLSYYLFFIFDKFKEYDSDEIWTQVKNDGVALLYKSRFTSLSLNADWIKIDKHNGKISTSKTNSFGYDALRIPFNILKSDIQNKAKLLEPYKNYVDSMKKVSSIFGVTDLKDGRISLYSYSYGHLSVYNMIDKYFNKSSSFTQKIKKLKGENRDDYYSHSIYLFTIFN